MPTIETNNLSKRYLPASTTKTTNEIRALEAVNLSIAPGEVYALLGPNGAGKTTLLSILTTLLLPSAGEATVAGYNVVTAPAQVRRRIGVTFQETVLDQQLTGRQCLHFHGNLYGMSKSDLHAAVDELTAIVDLQDALDRKVSTYSGGMKRRLELIRGLLTRPQILFLDEPTQGLDPQNRLTIWRYLAELRTRYQLTVLLTTHYMEEAEKLADRVGIINRGRLVQEGTPAALSSALGQDMIVVKGSGNDDRFLATLSDLPWARPVTRHSLPATANLASTPDPDTHETVIQVGVPDAAGRLAQLVTLANQAGFHIHTLTVDRPTLADVFLAATGSDLHHS